jgi:hypothetical protein
MRTISIGALVFTALAAASCSAGRGIAVGPQTATARPTVAPALTAPSATPAPIERRSGDFVVHLISGNFRKQPALLTERVVGVEGDTFVIEYKLEDNDGARTLRAWTNRNGQVARVTVVGEEGEQPGTLADYEALIASASLTPDENEGFSARTLGTCTVGAAELDCETKQYRVRIGDQAANLGITASRAVPGLDLSGEITAADGTVIYRSVLIEGGNDRDAKEPTVAVIEP